MAKRLSPPDVSKPYNPPRLPGNPIRAKNAERARYDRDDRRRFPGVAEGWSAGDLGRYSRGSLSNPVSTLKDEQYEFDTDPKLRRFERDLDKRPIRTGNLSGRLRSRALRGGKR